MILNSRDKMIRIAKFINKKKLLGKKRIHIHKNVSKSELLNDLKRYFQIISLPTIFRLLPLDFLKPILPEIAIYDHSPNCFYLNSRLVDELNDYFPVFFS